MNQVNDLQQLINKKVEKKLDTEITQFLDALLHNPFWNSINDLQVTINGNTESFRSAFWPGKNEVIFKKIKEKFLPEYIEAESEALLNTITALEKSENQTLAKISELQEQIYKLENQEKRHRKEV